jgi:hypothetical protein
MTSPLLGVHAWRQTDTAAIARNYHEEGYRLFHPQVDWRGDSSGYTETEFQLYPFTVSLLYRCFGVHEFLGRLTSVGFFIVSALLLHLLVSAVIDRDAAFYSTLFYSFLPTNVYYSRAFMPEATMLMCSVAGIYFFYRWTERAGLANLLLSAAFVSLAVLVKLPALCLGLPLLYLAWHKDGWRFVRRLWLWIYGVLVLVPVVLWYYHAHQLYSQSGLTFHIWDYGTEKWGNWSFALSFQYWSGLLVRLYQLHFAYYAIPLLLIGLVLKRRQRVERLIDFWMLAILVYLIVVPHGNIWHEYYQLPLMLPASVFIGKVFGRYFSLPDLAGGRSEKGGSLVLGILLLLTAFESLQIYSAHLKEEKTQGNWYVDLPAALDEFSESDDLVIAVSKGDPKLLYYAHRKGWLCPPSDVDAEYVRARIAKGAKCIIGLLSDFADPAAKVRLQDLANQYRLAYQDTQAFVIDLRKATLSWPGR